MNKIKTVIIIFLMIFSFYLSDKVTSLAIKKNPIMQEISDVSESQTVMSQNATILDNTIIPGISGKRVDEEASFFKMKEFGYFNKTFLIYKTIKPEISLEDNKDKVIIQGNKGVRKVSIIIEDDSELIQYFNSINIQVDVLSKLSTKFENSEYINAENTKDNFNDLESLLKKNNLNKRICILEYSNIEECLDKEYYLVKPNIVLSNTNILKNKQNISNGSIILINKNISTDSLNIIMSQIKYLDLNIVYLSELITE